MRIPAEPDSLAYEWGESPPLLDSQRVRLRPLRESDVDDVFCVYGDSAVMRYWSTPVFRERAQAQRLIEQVRRSFATRTLVEWGIVRPEDDVVLGTCSIFRIEPVHRRAEIGFALRRDDWGRGIASEAVATTVEFAFGPLDLIRIEADVDPRNDRSIRLLERLGFQREGYLRNRYIVSGEIQDTLFLGLLREEWRARP